MSIQTTKDHPFVTIFREILTGLCSKPERLRVTETHTLMERIVTVACCPEDYGKILGVQARLLKAFAAIFKAIDAKHFQRPTKLEYDYPKTRNAGIITRAFISDNYDSLKVRDMVRSICDMAFFDPVERAEAVATGTTTLIELVPAESETVDPDFINALCTVFHAYGRATGRPNVQVRCVGVS